MADLSDLSKIDIDKVIEIARQYAERGDDTREKMAEVTGKAESKDGRVKVVFGANGTLSDLELDPRALRMQSEALSSMIKQVVNEAIADLRANANATMVEIYGEEGSPEGLQKRREAAMQQAEDTARDFDRTIDKAMADIERISKQLGL
jgi:DNA-binding protein YbaB